MVGQFKGWLEKEMFAICLRELEYERIQLQRKQRVTEVTTAGVEPARDEHLRVAAIRFRQDETIRPRARAQ